MALRLSRHRNIEWEQSLGYPLFLGSKRSALCRAPLRMFLDRCNLPMGCRGMNLNDGGAVRDGDDGVMTVPPGDFHLMSKARRGDGRLSSDVAAVDWVPIFRSALSPPRAALVGVTVVFDDAKYVGARRGRSRGTGARFRLGPSPSSSAARRSG